MPPGPPSPQAASFPGAGALSLGGRGLQLRGCVCCQHRAAASKETCEWGSGTTAPANGPAGAFGDRWWPGRQVSLPVSLGNVGSQWSYMGWGAKCFPQKCVVFGSRFRKTQISVWTGFQGVRPGVTGTPKTVILGTPGCFADSRCVFAPLEHLTALCFGDKCSILLKM